MDTDDRTASWVLAGRDAAYQANACVSQLYSAWGADLAQSHALGHLAQTLVESMTLAYWPPRILVRARLDGRRATVSTTAAHPRLSRRRGPRSGYRPHPLMYPALDAVRALARQAGVQRIPDSSSVYAHASLTLDPRPTRVTPQRDNR